ncbi:MAG: 30S ribosomal protein S8 [Deltaproteobacteria bacterium]|nr:30S ribosomal protein S8 [Deltaproteobacteria bacterium]
MTDPIADFLTRIRNALMARHSTLSCPSSKMKVRISQILKDEGYISEFGVEKNDRGYQTLQVTLKYEDDRVIPIIEGLKRVSKPGLRIYRGATDLPTVRGGLGMAILSTSKGVMTDASARAANVGGEVLCHVW